MPGPTSTLVDIQTKVRRLTRSPSEAQLSTTDLNQYINTFVVYDFPEHLRTFNLRQPFTFVCNPYQGDYRTDTISFGSNTTNSLYNFQNLYLTVHQPVYIGGFQVLFTQSREQFFQIYPQVQSIQTIGVKGDGSTTRFTGVINTQQNNVINGPSNQIISLIPGYTLFDSIAANGEGVAMIDVPLVDNVTGNQLPVGNLYVPGNNVPKYGTVSALDPNNNINYVTGAFVVTFPSAPAQNATINSQCLFTQPSIPQAMLFYNNTFSLRPIPDQPYRVQFEVYANPVALLENNQNPQLNEWWQYIAYGASRKVLQDRGDLDTVALIDPEFKLQESLCIRRTMVQLANERAATIYTEQTGLWGADGWGRGGSLF